MLRSLFTLGNTGQIVADEAVHFRSLVSKRMPVPLKGGRGFPTACSHKVLIRNAKGVRCRSEVVTKAVEREMRDPKSLLTADQLEIKSCRRAGKDVSLGADLFDDIGREEYPPGSVFSFGHILDDPFHVRPLHHGFCDGNVSIRKIVDGKGAYFRPTKPKKKKKKGNLIAGA